MAEEGKRPAERLMELAKDLAVLQNEIDDGIDTQEKSDNALALLLYLAAGIREVLEMLEVSLEMLAPGAVEQLASHIGPTAADRLYKTLNEEIEEESND